MKKIDNIQGVSTLSILELKEIEGGRRLPSWRKIKGWLSDAVTYLGIADAVSEFSAGWNSVECGCE